MNAAGAARVRLGLGQVRAALPRVDRGILSIVDQGAISAGNFASTIVLARALDTSEFGLYVLANVVILFVTSLQNGLLLQPLVIIGAPLEDGVFGRFLRANVVLQAAFLVASCSLVAAVALAWEPLRPLAPALVAAAAFVQAQEFCRRALYARAEMGAALINNAISYDVQALLVGALAWAGVLDIGRALCTVAATSLLAVLAGAWQLRRFAAAGTDDPRAVARKSFALGKWSAASQGLSSTSSLAYPTIVTAVAGLTSTAGFGVMRQALGPLHLLTYPLDGYYLSRAASTLAREGASGLKRVSWEATRLIAGPYLLYTLAVGAAPELFLRAIYGESYVQYAGALRAYALVMLLFLPFHILVLAAYARRLQRYHLVSELWAVGTAYTVGLYLIARFGLIGAAATLAIGMAGQLVFLTVVLRRARPPEAAEPRT